MSPEERKPGASGRARRLPNAFSLDEMKCRWKASRDSQPSKCGKPGIDRVTAQNFAQNLDGNLKNIRRRIQTGEYHFSRLRIAPIEKTDGTMRIIAVPTVEDRFVQRVVLQQLESQGAFGLDNNISYGFQKGRKLTDAQLRAKKLREEAPWTLQADIVKFFDRIPRPIVKKRVAEVVKSKIVRELLFRIVDCELDQSSSTLAEVAKCAGIKPRRGLRQGMPASPFLSNLLLRDFDRALEKEKLRAVRYADDLTIFGQSKIECQEALDLIQNLLNELQLEIPELGAGSKTKILSPTEDVEFLGIVIRYNAGRCNLRAPTKQIAKIEDKLFKVATKGHCITHRRTLAQLSRDIDSITLGYERALALAENREEFSNRLAAASRKALRTLLVSLFGEHIVKKLGGDEKAILGIEPFGAADARTRDQSLPK